MKLLIYVLTKNELLSKLLHEFAENKIIGATIVNSTGMAQQLFNNDDLGILGSIRNILDPKRDESKTIYMVLKDEEVKIVLEIIEKIVGDLDEPDNGILFTVPIDYIKGLKKHDI